MHRSLFLAAFLATTAAFSAAQDAAPAWADGLAVQAGTFHGYQESRFKLGDAGGAECRIVAPKEAAEGRPWVWRARFWGHEPQADVALLERGWHVAYCDVANLFGSPAAVARWDAFYKFATGKVGLGKKPALEGMSRGGLIIFNWASANPGKVCAIYGDAPVCDLFSWPLGKGEGNGAAQACLKAYGANSIADLKAADPAMPKSGRCLKPIAEKKVPVLLVVGLADDVVPYADNGQPLAAAYKALGGPVEVIEKPGVGHHPHSLKDPGPIVDFILAAHAKAAAK